MKEIDSFEFSIENNVSEEKIIDFLSELLQISKDKFWNWDWDGDSKSEIAINISIDNIKDQNSLFIALLFNDAKTVSNLFELNIGLELAKKFNRSVIVSDPFIPDVYLQIHPNSLIDICEEGSDSNGNTIYNIPIEKDLEFDALKNKYLEQNLLEE